MSYEDIIYEKKEGIGWITINRPETYNSIVGLTIKEMLHAVTDSAEDPEVGVIVFTGAETNPFGKIFTAPTVKIFLAVP